MEIMNETKKTELNLKWNSFTENIISSLECSLGNQDFVDVTLVCEGGSIKAHRLVLSASSSFFQRILKENVCPHPIIVLKGVALSELETLLMFMYHGEAKTPEHNVPRLLDAAHFLEIRGLTSYECCQIPETQPYEEETTTNCDGFPEDLPQTGVHSTTQGFNGLSCVEPNQQVTRISQPSDVKMEQHDICDVIEVNIKQEPDDEGPNWKEFPAEVDLSQAPKLIETHPDENINLCLSEFNFSTQETIQLQQQKKLAFYEPRPCPKCRRVYRDAATLRNHLSIMHQVLPHKISCSCGSLFPTKHELYIHRKRGHKR